jgi:hypothetical protein
MQPITVDNTLLLGYTGGFTYHWHCWNCFLYGWEIREGIQLLPALNCNFNLN